MLCAWIKAENYDIPSHKVQFLPLGYSGVRNAQRRSIPVGAGSPPSSKSILVDTSTKPLANLRRPSRKAHGRKLIQHTLLSTETTASMLLDLGGCSSLQQLQATSYMALDCLLLFLQCPPFGMDGGSLPGREDESITGIFCGVFCICFLLQLPFCIDRGPEVHGVVDQFNLVIGALFIGHDCKWFCRSRGIVVLISTEDLLFFFFWVVISKF